MFRIEPLMPAQNYKTYLMARPLNSHWRAATCEEAGCAHYLNGWVTRVDESTDLGKGQAAYIRRDRSRSHKETRSADGLTEFTFPSGSTCFRASEHRVQLGRLPVFAVKQGDYRASSGTRVHKRAEDWVEDLGEHMDKLKTITERG